MPWSSRDSGSVDYSGKITAREIQGNTVKVGNNSDDTADNQLDLTNGGTGDAKIKLTAGAQTYSIGVDNSVGDRFNITNGTLLDATQGIVIDSANRVGIGGASSTAALLTLTSTTRGFLPSMMTAAQMAAIASPPESLMVYNTTSSALCIFVGSAWLIIQASLAKVI